MVVSATVAPLLRVGTRCNRLPTSAVTAAAASGATPVPTALVARALATMARLALTLKKLAALPPVLPSSPPLKKVCSNPALFTNWPQ